MVTNCAQILAGLFIHASGADFLQDLPTKNDNI